MGKILRKMNVLLDKKQKRSMALLVVIMIIGAGLQVAGVGMIVPVVNVVMNSDAVETNDLVRTMYQIVGGGSKQRFTVIIMLGLIGIFIVKNVFLYFQQKFTFAFVYTNQFRTSERMMKNYLRRGYEFYLNADTAVVQRSITSDVNNMYALILAILQLISDGIIFVFLVLYCLAQDVCMTILLAVVMLLLLWVIKKILKPILRKAGKENQDYYSGLFKWINQIGVRAGVERLINATSGGKHTLADEIHAARI
jgi:ABC-type multidrug transport system fused ATPase/permease subunit